MFYGIVKILLYYLIKILYRLEIKGWKNLPPTGPVIIAANHANLMDPIFVGCCLSRPVCFMAKEELFRIPVLGWIIRQLGAFPVKRGSGDRGALRAALQVLKQGKVIGIFPEGTRYKDGAIHPLKPGAAMLAAQSGACIVPVVISGTHILKLFRFPKIKVLIGEPFKVQLREAVDKKQQINAAKDELYRRLVLLWERATIKITNDYGEKTGLGF